MTGENQVSAMALATAAEVLSRAAAALRTGALSVNQQMKLARECEGAAWPLRRALEVINVKVRP